MRIIRKGHENEYLFGCNNWLLFEAWTDYRYEREAYAKAIDCLRHRLIEEARRLDSGVPAPDNSLGLIQSYGPEVDRRSATFYAARGHLLSTMSYFDVCLEAAMWPHEVREIEDKISSGHDACACDEPLLEPGQVGRVQCAKCGGAKEVR